MAGNVKRRVLNYEGNPPQLRDTVAGNTTSHGQVLAWDTNSQAFHLAQGGGGGGAPTDASYVTLAASGGLTAERVLTAGPGLTFQDGGAGAALTVSTVDLAPNGASYLTLSQDAGLTQERVLTAGTGITIQDGGAGAALTISATGGGGGAPTDASYVVLEASPGLSNEQVLVAGAGVTITSSQGQVTVAQDGTPVAKPFPLSGASQVVSVAAATLVVASAYLDPGEYLGAATTFQGILSAGSTTYTTRVRLYDVGAAAYVTDGTLTTSSTSPTVLSSLVTITSGLRHLEVHADLQGTQDSSATGVVGFLGLRRA